NRDEPLLRISFQRLAADAKLDRAALLLRAARVMVWIPLESYRRVRDRVGPGRLVAIDVGYEAGVNGLAQKLIKARAPDADGQRDLLVGLGAPARAVHH